MVRGTFVDMEAARCLKSPGLSTAEIAWQLKSSTLLQVYAGKMPTVSCGKSWSC
jgi:hypothetical protein